MLITESGLAPVNSELFRFSNMLMVVRSKSGGAHMS